MTLLGFQVVLLDEHLVVERRIPDVYYEDRLIAVDGHDYVFQWQITEDGQRVRYFKRATPGLYVQDVSVDEASGDSIVKAGEVADAIESIEASDPIDDAMARSIRAMRND